MLLGARCRLRVPGTRHSGHGAGQGDAVPGADAWINPGDSVVVAPGGKIVAGPLHETLGIVYADIDLERVGMARRSLDVVGHYARPDLFQLQVDRRPQRPVTELLNGDAP